jgi:hypothetical protein
MAATVLIPQRPTIPRLFVLESPFRDGLEDGLGDTQQLPLSGGSPDRTRLRRSSPQIGNIRPSRPETFPDSLPDFGNPGLRRQTQMRDKPGFAAHLRHGLLPASTSESRRPNWSNGACTPEVAQWGQVSAGAADYDLDNNASVRPICTLQRAGVSPSYSPKGD